MINTRSRVYPLALATFCTTLLAACGSDDTPTGASATPPSIAPLAAAPNDNSAPQLTGAPSATVLQDTAYAFAPQATDADGHTLTFNVANLPRWATFDAKTGRLSGKPTSAEIGVYDDIRISVSDGHTTESLAPFRITVTAIAPGSVMLDWEPPTENIDGSPLRRLGGYRVYWGPVHGHYPHSTTIDNPGLATYVVEQLAPGTWFFVVTAFTADDVESEFSNVASKKVG